MKQDKDSNEVVCLMFCGSFCGSNNSNVLLFLYNKQKSNSKKREFIIYKLKTIIIIKKKTI